MTSTTLTDKIKEVVLNDIKQIDLDRLNLYAHQNHQSLHALYHAEIINNAVIESALEQAVLTCAKRDYQSLVQHKSPLGTQYPDHLIRPELFAYAIEKGTFSDKELSQVKFDHSETAKTFPQSYHKENLLELLREELLHPKRAPHLGDDIYSCC